MGLSCYYNGRALVSELPEKGPDEYLKILKRQLFFLRDPLTI